MITCVPESVFGWNFEATGASGGPAEVTFNFFTEQGAIQYGGVEYDVRKHGMLSGEWTLEANGQVYARAVKNNPLTRKFQVEEGGGEFTLRALIMMRGYEILRGDTVIGTINPAHIFTRRSTIDCGPEMTEPCQLFCFWLAALTWRRAARSNSNN